MGLFQKLDVVALTQRIRITWAGFLQSWTIFALQNAGWDVM